MITSSIIVDGGWSEWMEVSLCSQSCGPGTVSKSRQCNRPKPFNGGLDCMGSDLETGVPCNNVNCPGAYACSLDQRKNYSTTHSSQLMATSLNGSIRVPAPRLVVPVNCTRRGLAPIRHLNSKDCLARDTPARYLSATLIPVQVSTQLGSIHYTLINSV